MTSLSQLFNTYIPCPSNLKIRIANGSLSPVAGTGYITISDSLTLKSVLHVPNLFCNPLSISKLTKDSNCAIKNFDCPCD